MPGKFRALCIEREKQPITISGGGGHLSIEPEFETKEEAEQFAKEVDRGKFYEPHVQEHLGGGMWRDI